jgi:uncharacterized protein YndB with AHSA1/START domain
MIKKLFIALAGIIVLLIAAIAITSFATPTDFKVERETTIRRPPAEIYAYAKMLKNQNEWGPWFKRDPQMHQEFRGTDGAVGFVVYWKGNGDTGEGEQEIKALEENRRIETELRFKQPWESKGDTVLAFESAGDQTRVKWTLAGSVPRPMNVLLRLMDMDAAMGNDLTEGLAGLKTVMEN